MNMLRLVCPPGVGFCQQSGFGCKNRRFSASSGLPFPKYSPAPVLFGAILFLPVLPFPIPAFPTAFLGARGFPNILIHSLSGPVGAHSRSLLFLGFVVVLKLLAQIPAWCPKLTRRFKWDAAASPPPPSCLWLGNFVALIVFIIPAPLKAGPLGQRPNSERNF